MVDDSGRPAKRRRIMTAPDGFLPLSPQNSSATKKHRVSSVPQFRSEFGEENTQPATPLRRTERAMNIPKAAFDSSLLASGQDNAKETTRKASMSRSRVEVGKENMPAPKAKPKSISSPALTRRLVDTPMKSRPCIPVLPVETPQRRPPPAPVTPRLKSLAPPPFPISKPPTGGNEHTTQTPLKTLQPPAISLPPETPSYANTINSTRVARITDLATEGGSAEVASIFLRDQFASPIGLGYGGDCIGDEMHIRRGQDFSPQKGFRGGPAFVRGGLAAQASALLSESHTSLTLWTKETNRRMLSSCPQKLQPDMRLRVLEVLPWSMFSATLTYATCVDSASPSPHNTQPNSSPFSVEFTPSPPFPFALNKTEKLRVLFSHARRQNTGKLFKGAEVLVWEPCDTVCVAPEDALNEQKVLLCSRFVVTKGGST